MSRVLAGLAGVASSMLVMALGAMMFIAQHQEGLAVVA
jgi:hypothetical protein